MGEFRAMVEKANNVGCGEVQEGSNRDATEQDKVHRLLNGKLELCFRIYRKFGKNRVHNS